MPNPRLAARYAKSLLDLAVEKEQLEQVYADMVWLQDVCKQSRDFTNMLRSPIIKADVKGKILNTVTKVHLSELSNAFNQNSSVNYCYACQ
jgi:F-type H+-transporting ATPase subunit delta